MIKFFAGLFVFFLPGLAVAQFTDNFTDGDFTSNPTWTGDDSVFTIVGNQLRSDKILTNSTFYLSTASVSAVNCQWEFLVNLKFATSGANYADVYLIADQSNLKAANLNGYFIRIGGTSDNISLFKKTAGSNTALITGTAAVLTSSSNNMVKVKVTRDAAGQFTLFREFTTSSFTGNYTSEGSITDAAFTTSSFFGISITQSTASFFQKHFFDDFYVGPIILDTTPPQIVSASPVSANAVDVLFSENVEQISAETTANYSIAGIGQALLAQRDVSNNSLVHLTFGTNFTNGSNYILTVNNVSDLATNAIAANSMVNFSYIIIEAAASKDLVINEVYADPSPSYGLPTGEFVEIYNRSNKYISLAGFRITDGLSTGTVQSKTIAPNSYFILTPNADTLSYQSYGTTAGVVSFPSLNNDGDSLWLKDNLGNTIDFVVYNLGFYHDADKEDGGYTMERKNPNDTCLGQSSNWSASTNNFGGTPGIINSNYDLTPDTQAPVLLSATVLSTTSLVVTFNETLDAGIANNISHYVIAGNSVLSAIATGDLSNVVLTLSTPIDSGVIYSITVNGLADCKGNVLNTAGTIFTIYNRIKPYDIVINEVMADPEPVIGLPGFEYIELYNRRQYPLSLNGVALSIGTTTKVLSNTIIQAGGYVIVCAEAASPLYTGYGTVSEQSTFSLTNSGTTLTLTDTAGNVIHSISFTDEWYKDNNKKEGGYSLEQIDYNNPCGGIENWSASKNTSGGTPGAINSVYAANADTKSPTLIRASVTDSLNVILYFSESIDSTTSININDYTIDNGMGHPLSINPVEPEFTKMNLRLAFPVQRGVIYTVTSTGNIKDCAGQSIGSPNTARFAVPEKPSAKDVVINEVLYNPNTDGVDFVEVYNRSAKILDFKDLRIASFDTVANALESIKAINTEGYLIFPGDYVVITTDWNAVKKQYRILNENAFVEVESMPAFSISDGRVVISDVQQNIIDRFDYTDEMQFPLLNDSKGVSLERLDFERETQDKTNWHSASETAGFATPGYKNSQYFVGESNADITISPEVFSPDNDGYQDNVAIAYKMSGAGFVASLTVFDASGRLVRNLEQNVLLGESGAFSWDGINNNNEKSRIGIYIIYFTAYNTSGETVSAKKQCVLASKL